MIYAIYVALVLAAFLVVLNGFLRGAKKAQIDAVLSLLLLGLVITAFFVAGWKLGLLAIVIAFLSAVATRPIAARLASRLFSTSSGGGKGYVGLPPRPLQKISQELGKSIDPNKLMEDMFSSSDRKANAEEVLLDYCEQQPSIQALLREFGVSRKGLQELYNKLIMVGAGQWTCGHWVPASALAYPESLRYILSRREENIKETAFNLIMYFEQGSPLQI
jgi:ABC-type multidrug transport system fused ATPase/permease subunit